MEATLKWRPHSGQKGIRGCPRSLPHFKNQRRPEWEACRRHSRVLPAALGCAARGRSVFPCRARGKEPLTDHGFKDATTNLDEIRAWWSKWPEANVAIATGSRSNLLVLDIDPRNGGDGSLAALEKSHCALPRDYVVETSDRGLHYYFRLPDGLSIPCSVLADGIDIKCEGGYVMAPPSIHPSGHRYRRQGSGDVPAAPDWLVMKLLQKAGAQAHAGDGPTINVDELHVSDDIKRRIRQGVPKGQRSNKGYGAIRAMVNAGHSDDEIISIMMNPDYGISQKPRQNGLTWLKGEVARARTKPDRGAGNTSQGDDTASSNRTESGGPSGAKTNGSASGASRPGSSEKAQGSTAGFKLLSIDDLKRMPPPTWLLSDLLVAGSLAVLYGPPGVGKSFLALDFALSISTGCEGVAEPNGCGPVVYLAAEGFGGLIQRVAAWELAHSRKAADIHFLPEAVNLIGKADTDKLIASVRALPTPPLLIVIDTMARCLSGGDENSAKDVGQFVAMIDALRSPFKCAALVVHHGTKSNAKTERGSSALRGAADTMLFLDSHFGALTLSCEKQKDAAEFKSRSLRRETIELPGGDTSCVMRSDGGAATGTDPGSNEHGKAILDILATAGESTYTELKDRFMANTERSKRTFERALATLTAAGSIKKTAAGNYVLA